MPKCFKRFEGVVLLGCSFVLLILGYLAYCFVFAVVDNTIGLNGRTAGIQWYRSMQRGDGQAAIYWARRTIYFDNPTLHETWKSTSYPSLPEDYGMTHDSGMYLTLAYELYGEYDLALKRYQMSDLPRENTPHIPRVLYKMGRYSGSFEEYCEFYKEQAETYDDLERYRKDMREESLYNGIMCHRIFGDNSRKFRPFATFHDFYEFMEKECEKQGGPGQYAKVMELFRRVDSQADSLMADAERFLSDRHE